MKKKIFFYSLLILFLFVFAELATRIVYWTNDFFSPSLLVRSDELGWIPVPNQQIVRKFRDYGNIEYRTVDRGFRVFGNVNTDKAKLFTIGDSYTHAAQVSNGDAYYDWIGKEDPHLELFVFGCNGYGTYQESLVIDKYYEEIQPDIILWQLCGNDIIDNSYELECDSLYYNQYMLRPYYSPNGAYTAYPRKGLWKCSPYLKIVQAINVVSHVSNFLLNERPFSKKYYYMNHHPAYQDAVENTLSLYIQAIANRDRTTFVFFSVDDSPWVPEIMAELTERENVYYIDNILQRLKQAEKEGHAIQGPSQEGHWNKDGHQIVGRVIYDCMISNNILSSYNK